MSSRNSSFDIGAAMDQPSSPIDSSPPDWMRSSPNKRAHSPTDEEDDGHNSDRVIDPALRNEGPSGAAIVPRQTSQNLTTFAKRYATKRKLNPQQVNEVLTFVADLQPQRQIKLFTHILALEEKLENIITAAPDWELSSGLQTNIDSYVVAVMLSSSLHAYKGEGPVNHILNILKKNRFDMPPGVESDAAKWKKVIIFVQDSFTERRAAWKKILKKSVEDRQNIYDVSALLVKKSNCKVTAPLCSRVALMRSVYRVDPSSSFWKSVDSKLMEIRNKAGTGENRDKRISKGFKAILKQDREDFGGIDNPVIDNDYTGSDLQVLVEEHIEAAV